MTQAMAMKFNALSAATYFDFCFNDYYVVQGRPGLWRLIHSMNLVPEWAFLAEAVFDGQVRYFFRDDQAVEELTQYIEWAHRTQVQETQVLPASVEAHYIELTTRF